MSGQESGRARFGPFEVDLDTQEVWKSGTRLKLTGQPFAILAILMRRAGAVVTREELSKCLWPADVFVDYSHGLNAAVNKLREALCDSAENPRYIETLPRRGYRFIAIVEWLDWKQEAAAAEIPPDRETTWRRIRPRYVVAGAVLLSLALGSDLLRLLSRCCANDMHSIQRKTTPLTSVNGVLDPAFSPDGNRVAFVRDGARPEGNGIFVTSLAKNEPVQLTRNEGDSCPVWSPDGRSIAFSRFANGQYSLYVVPARRGSAPDADQEIGSGEHRLDTHGVALRSRYLDWSPDGKSIAFAGEAGIYLLFPENSALRRITTPPPAAQDWGPSFSPEGGKLLFVRNRQSVLLNEIWVASIRGGEAQRVLLERGRLAGAPHWSPDRRSVIYASNRSGHPVLWRAPLDASDMPVQISEAGSMAWGPAISPTGYRLAYERLARSLSIWQMDLSTGSDRRPHVLVASTSDTDQGPGPQFSPDGKKLAYMSDRSGTMEIWVSNRDGSHPFQVTAVGGAGTPRWSPDSQSIVFDANTPNGVKILSMNARGGAPQVLTPDPFSGVCPSWSRDGKWVYFASEPAGPYQVWKVPSGGGMPVQVTRLGGHAALESPDGKTLYYAKNAAAEPEIWQIPVSGGPEARVPAVRPGTWASWNVVDGGILFVGPSQGHRAVLSFFDFATGRTNVITVLGQAPFWLGSARDGRTVAFDQPEEQAQAMLIENFR